MKHPRRLKQTCSCSSDLPLPKKHQVTLNKSTGQLPPGKPCYSNLFCHVFSYTTTSEHQELPKIYQQRESAQGHLIGRWNMKFFATPTIPIRNNISNQDHNGSFPTTENNVEK